MSHPGAGRKTQKEIERGLRDCGPELAWKLRRARDYHEDAKHYAIWANPTFAEVLRPGAPYRDPRNEHPLTMRFRLDARLGKPHHSFGSCFAVPPDLDPFARRPGTNGRFYGSPGCGPDFTLGEMTRIGRMYSDDDWVQRLCLDPPITIAHGIGLSGETRPHSLEDLIAWLNRNARSGWPDYVAACFDMYFAGVGSRIGVLPGRNPAVNEKLARAERAREEAERRSREFFAEDRAKRLEAVRQVEAATREADTKLLNDFRDQLDQDARDPGAALQRRMDETAQEILQREADTIRALEDILEKGQNPIPPLEQDPLALGSGREPFMEGQLLDERTHIYWRQMENAKLPRILTPNERAYAKTRDFLKRVGRFEKFTEQNNDAIEHGGKFLKHRKGTRMPSRPITRPVRGR